MALNSKPVTVGQQVRAQGHNALVSDIRALAGRSNLTGPRRTTTDEITHTPFEGNFLPGEAKIYIGTQRPYTGSTIEAFSYFWIKDMIYWINATDGTVDVLAKTAQETLTISADKTWVYYEIGNTEGTITATLKGNTTWPLASDPSDETTAVVLLGIARFLGGNVIAWHQVQQGEIEIFRAQAGAAAIDSEDDGGARIEETETGDEVAVDLENTEADEIDCYDIMMSQKPTGATPNQPYHYTHLDFLYRHIDIKTQIELASGETIQLGIDESACNVLLLLDDDAVNSYQYDPCLGSDGSTFYSPDHMGAAAVQDGDCNRYEFVGPSDTASGAVPSPITHLAASCDELPGDQFLLSDDFGGSGYNSGTVGDANWNHRWSTSAPGASTITIEGGSLELYGIADGGRPVIAEFNISPISGDFWISVDISGVGTSPPVGASSEGKIVVVVGAATYQVSVFNPNTPERGYYINMDGAITSGDTATSSGTAIIQRTGSTVTASIGDISDTDTNSSTLTAYRLRNSVFENPADEYDDTVTFDDVIALDGESGDPLKIC